MMIMLCRDYHSRETKAKYVRVISSINAPKDNTPHTIGEDGKYVWLGNAYCGQHCRDVSKDNVVTVEWLQTYSEKGVLPALKVLYDTKAKAFEEAKAEREKEFHAAQIRSLKQKMKLVESISGPVGEPNTLYEATVVMDGGEYDGKEVQKVTAVVDGGVAMIKVSYNFQKQSPTWIDLMIEAMSKAKAVVNKFNEDLM